MTRALILSTAITALTIGAASPALAGDCNGKTYTKAEVQQQTMVKGAHAKMEKGTIVDKAVKVDALSTLVTAVKAADLVAPLSSEGPFTVFAPTNMAFDALPDGTVPTLLKAENKHTLQGVLKYHVVAGNLTAADIIGKAKANGGTVTVDTLAGGELTAILAGDMLYVKDEKGGLAAVKTADIKQSNGVVHVIDRVLMPAS